MQAATNGLLELNGILFRYASFQKYHGSYTRKATWATGSEETIRS